MSRKKRQQPNPQQQSIDSVDDIEGKLQQAISLYQTGQLQQSEQMCQQILRDNSQHAEALHLLGVIAHQVGEYSIATSLITQAIEIDSNQSAFFYNLGNVLKEKGKLRESIQAYQRALEIQPQFAEAYNNLGIVSKEQARVKMINWDDYGLKHGKSGASFDPSHKTYLVIGPESSGTKIVAKWIGYCIGLLDSVDDWWGFWDIESDDFTKKVCHRSFPHHLRDGYHHGSFEEWDKIYKNNPENLIVIICLRDINISSISTYWGVSLADVSFDKVLEQKEISKKYISDYLNQDKYKFVLFSYEIFCYLQNEYLKHISRKIGIECKDISVKNGNSKYVKDLDCFNMEWDQNLGGYKTVLKKGKKQ